MYRGLEKEEINVGRKVLSATGVTDELPKAVGDEEDLRRQVGHAQSYRLDRKRGASAKKAEGPSEEG